MKFIITFEVESNSGSPSHGYVFKVLGSKYEYLCAIRLQIQVVGGHKGFVIKNAQDNCTALAIEAKHIHGLVNLTCLV